MAPLLPQTMEGFQRLAFGGGPGGKAPWPYFLDPITQSSRRADFHGAKPVRCPRKTLVKAHKGFGADSLRQMQRIREIQAAFHPVGSVLVSMSENDPSWNVPFWRSGGIPCPPRVYVAAVGKWPAVAIAQNQA